jgi:hypothetical protein
MRPAGQDPTAGCLCLPCFMLAQTAALPHAQRRSPSLEDTHLAAFDGYAAWTLLSTLPSPRMDIQESDGDVPLRRSAISPTDRGMSIRRNWGASRDSHYDITTRRHNMPAPGLGERPDARVEVSACAVMKTGRTCTDTQHNRLQSCCPHSMPVNRAS